MSSPLSLDDLRRRRGEILRIARGRRAESVAVFGSVARGEAGEDSDIDLLVHFGPGATLLDLVHLTDELTALLGRPVDVISAGGLKPRDDKIRREAVAL